MVIADDIRDDCRLFNAVDHVQEGKIDHPQNKTLIMGYNSYGFCRQPGLHRRKHHDDLVARGQPYDIAGRHPLVHMLQHRSAVLRVRRDNIAPLIDKHGPRRGRIEYTVIMC